MGALMLRMARAAQPRCASLLCAGRTQYAVRNYVGIKILEEKGKAQENMCWAQEDEKLLKQMIANNPELDPAYQGIKGMITNDAAANTTDKVKLIFMKHGIPPMNKALIADIVALVDKA